MSMKQQKSISFSDLFGHINEKKDIYSENIDLNNEKYKAITSIVEKINNLYASYIWKKYKIKHEMREHESLNLLFTIFGVSGLTVAIIFVCSFFLRKLNIDINEFSPIIISSFIVTSMIILFSQLKRINKNWENKMAYLLNETNDQITKLIEDVDFQEKYSRNQILLTMLLKENTDKKAKASIMKDIELSESLSRLPQELSGKEVLDLFIFSEEELNKTNTVVSEKEKRKLIFKENFDTLLNKFSCEIK